ncbi:MAG: hypothetical protein B6I22_06745 [Desulfobacteraceae bacterium 4572_123]|nr:MAG: hypothetical protein B6I22_06745 [Desulfobacteraceae bacterium 4572_123]
MENINDPVWVVAEQTGGDLRTISLQLVGKARQLADQLGTPLEVVLLGKNSNLNSDLLIASGADTVFTGDFAELAFYQPDLYTEMIVSLAKNRKPGIMLMGSTDIGRELAPLVAARLQTGLTAHCIDLVIAGNKILEQKIPAYGGLITITCPQKRPQMATVAKGVFQKPELDRNRTGTTISLDLPDDLPERIRTIEIIREEPEGIPLESASIVVAGGVGACDAEGWHKISALAKTLKAALGATRPAVDAGWTELESMIGQSGKMVSPDLYIGAGLSGEQQHMVGITNAKIMVAVNNDAGSPVFEQVDYGVVDDCREFIPVLIDKIKQYQKGA